MTPAELVVQVLRDPAGVLPLSDSDWTALLSCARAESLLGSVAVRLAGLPVPDAVQRVLDDAHSQYAAGRVSALWEADCAARALADYPGRVVLMKGTAYLAADLAAGQGRSVGDLDIMATRADLPQVEALLLAAGWEWVKPDPYDDQYYREYMHELPPLIHRDRDKMIDVHHTILPLTARPTPLPVVLLDEAERLESGLYVFSPTHMIIHCVAHLLADGDLAGGLRNLWDFDQLCREFSEQQEDFYLGLIEEASFQGLTNEVLRALRLSKHLFGTPVPEYREPVHYELSLRFSDRLFIRRLLARNGWGQETRPVTRLAFYVRSHWLRMPPLMLAKHLWVKWRKG